MISILGRQMGPYAVNDHVERSTECSVTNLIARHSPKHNKPFPTFHRNTKKQFIFLFIMFIYIDLYHTLLSFFYLVKVEVDGNWIYIYLHI